MHFPLSRARDIQSAVAVFRGFVCRICGLCRRANICRSRVDKHLFSERDELPLPL